MLYDKKEEMVGTAEAARILGISQHHVREYARSGKIPCFKLVEGGDWRYPVRDLEAIAGGRSIPQRRTPPLKEQIPTKDFSGDHHNKVEQGD